MKICVKGLPGWLLILSTSSFLWTSCKKGDTGPAGTANVSFSDWFTPASYKKDTVFGTYVFSYNQAAPAITSKLLDSGTVIVFGKLLGYNPLEWPVNQVSALPITLTYQQSGNVNIDVWTAAVSPGNVNIRFTNSVNYYGSIANAHKFRYILIPGGAKIPAFVRGRLVTQQVQHLDDAGYVELCQSLGIPQ